MLPREFLSLLAHPDPALHYPAHDKAQLPSGYQRVAHERSGGAGAEDLARLRAWAGEDRRLQELVAFHEQCDGAEIGCPLDDSAAIADDAALAVLSIADSDDETEDLPIDFDFLIDDMEDIYFEGNYRIVATSPTESCMLAVVKQASWEGADLSGNVLYLAMDPALDFIEPVAPSFGAMLQQLAADPAAFLSRIGYCAKAQGSDGRIYGRRPDRYVADVTARE